MGLLQTIKDKVVQTYDNVKNFVVEKWQQFTSTPIVQGATNLVKNTVQSVKNIFTPATTQTQQPASTGLSTSAMLGLAAAAVGAFALLR